MRITLIWDVPDGDEDALIAEFEEVAQRHGATMPDLWEEQRERQRARQVAEALTERIDGET